MIAPPPISFITYRRWTFLSFLVALHLVFMQGPETELGRWLFLSHIGIGLLWQPFVQPRRRVGFIATALVVFSAAFFAYALNWGFLLLWTMLLTGVVGGKVFMFHDRWERLFHLLALGYLATMVFALILPNIVVVLASPAVTRPVLYLAPIGFLLMAVLPARVDNLGNRAEIVDYVYGVMVFLLLAVIALGSLSFALLFKAGYFEALLMTLALVAGTLLLLGFIWDPRAGFGGLGSAMARHVMSLGLPIEDWFEALARLAQHEEDPARFMALACAELPRRLPGVVGGEWEARSGNGSFGARGASSLCFEHGQLKLTLHLCGDPSPSLHWYYDLAVRLLAEIQLGKWRAQELQRLSYIEAINETGARLTHDVKNLLQSLDTLCLAAEQEGESPSPRLMGMLRRQLPEISTRLRQTLNKLSAPERDDSVQPMPAAAWLTSMSNRFGADWIAIAAETGLSGCVVSDPSLFYSIAENLLQNIDNKRRTHPEIGASLRLACHADGASLAISDNGGAIPQGLADVLFTQRVPSESGLGIGLYQCARLARERGYRLELAENRDGCVCFRLSPPPRQGEPDRPFPPPGQ